MGYRPKFTITSRLSAQITDIAAMREKLSSLKSSVASDRDTQSRRRTRGHQIHRSSGTASMPLTLERVLALANGEDFPVVTASRERQVLNYFARCSESKPGQDHLTQ